MKRTFVKPAEMLCEMLLEMLLMSSGASEVEKEVVLAPLCAIRRCRTGMCTMSEIEIPNV